MEKQDHNNPAEAKREKGEGIDRKGMENLALISVAVIAALTLVGGELKKIFGQVSEKLGNAKQKE
ncbi:Flp family type IVb pilin [Helcococcus ovis]|uniref:Flp family type IVb pilin n=1 Tax=Helcococcus ovis TaxID=72026 RepID=UPI0038BB28CC